MTDRSLIEKKLTRIEICVRELRQLAPIEDVRNDLKTQRFAEHTLQIAIQAALDSCARIVSDDRLGEPKTNRALFELVANAGYIPHDMLDTLRNMVGFRNIIVHGYDTVDLEVVVDVLENRLDDLLRFAEAMRTGIQQVGTEE